jgi:uncharacterized protein YjiS (DUF1127 family)
MPGTSHHQPRSQRILDTAAGLITQAFVDWIERFRWSVRRRKTILELADLSDEQLVDIGLSREAIRITELTGRLPRSVEDALERECR